MNLVIGWCLTGAAVLLIVRALAVASNRRYDAHRTVDDTPAPRPRSDAPWHECNARVLVVDRYERCGNRWQQVPVARTAALPVSPSERTRGGLNLSARAAISVVTCPKCGTMKLPGTRGSGGGLSFPEPPKPS